MKEDLYKKYANYLTKALKPHLQKNIGLDVSVYPSPEGGVFEIKLGKSRDSSIILNKPESSLNEILKHVPQRLVSGNLDGVKLLGTNISMEGDRILFIKGEGADWDESDASENIGRVLEISAGGK
ncbi:MAG TPA: hypothetical protein ENJ28_00805 [Gammaproteobacteria bacterium]|nr:hypothetical protein [Gammaproteobacteria bacterium]